MEWFKSEFAKSNIIGGLLALAIWGVICYLAIVGRSVPEILYYGGASVIAFFFGSKAGQVDAKSEMVRELRRIEEGYDD